MTKEEMEKIYTTLSQEDIPWNIETPPFILKDIVLTGKIKPCRVIEFGCGIGNYVIFFAQNGFTATGVDISEKAVELAKISAENKNISCKFISADVLGDMSEVVDTYDFVYDWEVLHHIFPADRKKYIENVNHLLNPGGSYLSVCFSEDSMQFGAKGKYRKTPLNTTLYFSSEKELHTLFGSLFDIQELKTVTIKGKGGDHKAIYSFMKKKI